VGDIREHTSGSEPAPERDRDDAAHDRRNAGQGWGAGGFGADPVPDDRGYGDPAAPEEGGWGKQGFGSTDAALEPEDDLEGDDPESGQPGG
jgi:hypothetical protein